MICPGVKRPPPMGSELSSGLLLAGVCGARREERDGVFRVTGDAGATVAPSRLAPSPRTVAPVSESTASPHKEQNLPFEETCAPQFEQSIGSGDSTIGARPAANAREKQLGNALHLDGRAIREHFRDSLHHLGGVIAHGDK